jgi:hypothetical protein
MNPSIRNDHSTMLKLGEEKGACFSDDADDTITDRRRQYGGS